MSDIEANKKIQTLLHKCLLFELYYVCLTIVNKSNNSVQWVCI